jgi:predicted AAA+ superfamily ATPase
MSALASPLGVDSKTIDRWLTLLEQMFVLRRVRAWHRNDLKRLVKTPKLHVLDTGLLAALRRVGASDIESDRNRLGTLLEGFVYSELEKQSALSPDPAQISHYRDKDKVEVDFVLERGGRLVGIEVKASATVKTDDTHGLKRLQDAAGKAFTCGIILHDGERIQRIGNRMFAMPVNQLWAC